MLKITFIEFCISIFLLFLSIYSFQTCGTSHRSWTARWSPWTSGRGRCCGWPAIAPPWWPCTGSLGRRFTRCPTPPSPPTPWTTSWMEGSTPPGETSSWGTPNRPSLCKWALWNLHAPFCTLFSHRGYLMCECRKQHCTDIWGLCFFPPENRKNANWGRPHLSPTRRNQLLHYTKQTELVLVNLLAPLNPVKPYFRHGWVIVFEWQVGDDWCVCSDT